MSKLLNNQYRIIRSLGRGGCGQTFLAEDTYLPSNLRCVVKQLSPTTTDPTARRIIQERFQREAVVLETIGKSHDQIPALYSYFTKANEFYLVQQWIEGKNLSQKVTTGGRFSEDDVKAFLVSFLPILAYVHSQRIIHRDIKPENILIQDKGGKPVLIDFGAVKEAVITTASTEGTLEPTIVIGTREFMPPEQLRGEPVYASDLYGLGLTAIFLLTGKRPHELGTDSESGRILWRKHVSIINSKFAAVLDKAIQPLTKNRYQSANEMLKALQPPAPTPIPKPRNIVVILSLIAALVVGVGALLFIKTIKEHNAAVEQKEKEAQAYRERIEKENHEKEIAAKESQQKLEQEKAAREVAESRLKELQEYAGSGKINSVTVDHNVFENKIKGMRIHIKFEVKNFRDVKCAAAAYFEYESGEMLKSSDGRYEASSGQVALSSEFIPPYLDTTFNDLMLFLPYDEIPAGKGTTKLRFSVRLYKVGGKFFAQSEYFPFNLSR